MAASDGAKCPAVEGIPGKVSGAWVFRGTRTPVALVFENLEDGTPIDELIEQFPVTREQGSAVLEFAARSLEVPVPVRCMCYSTTESHAAWRLSRRNRG